MQEIAERYIAPFNETDAERRSNLLRELYTTESTYTDPHVDLRGLEAIGDFIAQTQQRFPGVTFRLRGPVDAHHNQARFQWQAGPADQPDQFIGFDVIVTNDGRIKSVYGFTNAGPSA